jgi:hypothetical protein
VINFSALSFSIETNDVTKETAPGTFKTLRLKGVLPNGVFIGVDFKLSIINPCRNADLNTTPISDKNYILYSPAITESIGLTTSSMPVSLCGTI